MTSLLNSIYLKLPVHLQSALLSLYGLKLRGLRHSNYYHERLKWLREVEFSDSQQMEQLQQLRLRSILRQAISHTEYYSNMAAKLGLAVDDEFQLDQLSRLPILEKSALRGSPELFRANNISRDQCTVINTSGTSGSPLEVLATKLAIQENYAFFSRFLAAIGVSPFDRSVTFAGRMIISTNKDAPPFHRFNAATNTYLFSSYHLSEANLIHYVRALEKISPVYIDSYPSAIGVLARFIKSNNVDHSIRPRAIITSSETLTDQRRSEIEEVFGCKVYDQYGCAEMACFVYQCAEGKYHAASEYGIVEVVDSEGVPVAAGVEGDLVLTGFVNSAFPLIRYRIGDRGALSNEKCRCGRSHPVLGSLLGRMDDIIVTPEGHMIGRMDPLFKGVEGVAAAQIIQHELDQLEVLVVPGADYSAEAAALLISKIGERVGPSMKVRITVVDDIPRTPNGKLRAVISRLPKSTVVNAG